jgi:hypothetical protein
MWPRLPDDTSRASRKINAARADADSVGRTGATGEQGQMVNVTRR